jgi:dipeptidyl-peptidase-4
MIKLMAESFPRQRARTRNFTIGVPKAFQLSPDGGRITFLRARSGDDPVTCLWELTVETGVERIVADPRALGADDENLPPEERARRERVRETGSGIVSYATDASHRLAIFPLSGQVYAVNLGEASDLGEASHLGEADGPRQPRLIGTETPALDPRPDPAGTKVGYINNGAFRIMALKSGEDTVVAQEDGVTFGLAEFVAAEEMGRSRGYWWSPDGAQVLLARVDERPVNTWFVSDPANPDREPVPWKYPAAGTPNADVRLFIATPETGELTPVPWDTEAFPYFVTASWGERLLIVTQSRDQKTMRLSDAATGEVYVEDRDRHWTDIVSGVPAQLPGGDVATTRISDDTRGLVVAPAGELATAAPVTPPGLHVREILGTDGGTVLFSASTEPTEVGVWSYGPGGLAEVATGPGVHTARASRGTTVVASRTLADHGLTVTVTSQRGPVNDPVNDPVSGPVAIESFAEEPNLPAPEPRFLEAGPAGIRTAVLFPSWHKPGDRQLPVLMDPYGGPHAQRVLKTSAIFLQSQWLAEQGFAVVVADGRGTPGRGAAWDRAVAGDLATPVLEDQVTALHAAASAFTDLDVSRVGIRGWSFGGYLSALAVLRRPDVFHAAVAGAPVTDWSMYDTHYTERYLGTPAADPAAYEVSSLDIFSAGRPAPCVHRPLLIIHGLADDNVLVAHSLRLSSALLAAGYPHSVLPLSGVTHMTPQEAVAENLLLLQVDFLKSALGVPLPPRGELTGSEDPLYAAAVRTRKAAAVIAVAVVAAALCWCYWRLSWTAPATSDGAAIALQARDMLNGNVLLRGWTIGDVSFYTTELPEYMLVEVARGLGPGTIHIAAAMTYTVLVLAAGLVARGRTRGGEGLIRALVAAGIMLAPQLGYGAFVLLLSPDHTGTQVPLLAGWLLLDLAPRRWYVPAAIGALLAWVQVADRVAVLTAVAPLILVCCWRVLRSGALRRLRSVRAENRFELSLAAAAAVSAGVAQAVGPALAAAGGFRAAPLRFAPSPLRAVHLRLTGEGILELFGANFEGVSSWPAYFFAVIHLAGLVLAASGLVLALGPLLRGRPDADLVSGVLAAAIVCNLAGYVATSAPGTVFGTGYTAREIAAVLPLGAVLAGRELGVDALLTGTVLARRTERPRGTVLAGAGSATGRSAKRLVLAGLIGVLGCYTASLAYGAARPAAPGKGAQLARWLATHRLTCGLGGVVSNVTTVESRGTARLAVVTVRDGRIEPLVYQAAARWYDASRCDATFLVADDPGDGAGYPGEHMPEAAAVRSFGAPSNVYHFGGYTVMTWKVNLLTRLGTGV